jgi:signal transduction histidine kinase
VNEVADSLLWTIIPLVLVPLLALQFFQVPIAVSLARRVRRHEAERNELLETTVSVSEKERIQIAADLHDGPIQDLAGISYALGAVAPTVPAEHQSLMGTVQNTVKHAIESLRWLMIELYPPDLSAGQLEEAFENLAIPLRAKGLSVDVQVAALPGLSGETVNTLYRVSRETLGNILKHAEASEVSLSLTEKTLNGGPAVHLHILDDGIGIDPARIERRAEGHLGLRLLIDRVAGLGGRMTVEPGPNGGTAVDVALPIMAQASGSDVRILH